MSEKLQIQVDPETAAATRQLFRETNQGNLILLGALAVFGTGAAYLAAGMAGAWGALIGLGVAALFALITFIAGLMVADKGITVVAGVLIGEWLVKVIVLIVVALVIRDQDFYDKIAFFLVVAVAVLGFLGIEVRAAAKARLPYVAPAK